ncbi:endonuclease [Aureococcus anophagefferens]|nr:endonuclease [Aureococcus anophagefferens]
MGIKGLMGVINEHAPGAVKELVIEGYTGRVVAIDASMSLYQFLIAIRHQGEGGAPSSVLTNAEGEQTSHIQGMFNRTIRLLQAGVRPVYVFDGKPPNMKGGELAKRTAKRQEAEAALKKATENDDAEGISKYSALLTKVSRKDCDDVKQLLRLMGVPVVDAPCEAEAQCAELVRGGKAHAVGTEDMDALTFGSTRQLRNMTFTKKSKDDKVLEITHAAVLEGLGLSNAEFVDFCILCGCDYTSTIRGVGPKTALKLVKEHGSIEAILAKGLKAKQRGDVPDEWVPPADRVAKAPPAPAPKKADAPKEPSPTKVDDDGASRRARRRHGRGRRRRRAARRRARRGARLRGDVAAGLRGGVAARQRRPRGAAVAARGAGRRAAAPAAPEAPKPEATPEAPEDEVPAAEAPAAPAAEAPAAEAPAAEDDADDGPFVPAYVGARNLFNNHEVTPCGDVELSWGKPDEAGLRAFLVERMGFGEQRVEGALKRLTSAQGQRTQRRMDSFFKVLPPKPGAAPKKRPAPEKKAPAKKKGKGPPRK